MRFCDTDALATGQSRGYSPNVSFLARPFSHATGQEGTYPNGSSGALCFSSVFLDIACEGATILA